MEGISLKEQLHIYTYIIMATPSMLVGLEKKKKEIKKIRDDGNRSKVELKMLGRRQ